VEGKELSFAKPAGFGGPEEGKSYGNFVLRSGKARSLFAALGHKTSYKHEVGEVNDAQVPAKALFSLFSIC